MNTENTTQDVQTTQEGGLQTTGDRPQEVAAGVWVPISQIVIPEDVRPHTPEDIDSRALSMGREGQEQNALLSKEGEKLVLVYGHGRLLSAQKLGWEKLRCDIKEGLTETQKLMLALAENAERENESPFHTAMVYQKLMEIKGLTQEQLAKELGKGLTRVEEYVRLAKVAPEVRKTPAAAGVSIRQCLAIAKLTNVEDQLKVMEECATQALAGKALEARVMQLLKPETPQAKAPKTAPAFQFHWKGRELNIKVRPFRVDEEEWTAYSLALDDAASKFRAAFPAPEVVETAQAA